MVGVHRPTRHLFLNAMADYGGNMTKNIPWIKEFPSDELKEIATFSLSERGAYFSLKLIYHTNPEAFENEQKLFAMCFAFDDAERTAVRTVVERLFKQSGVFPFNERLNNLEEKAVVSIEQKQKAGIASGIARNLKRTVVRTTVRTISEPEPEPEPELKEEPLKKTKAKKAKKAKKVSLDELSVNHIREWLAKKRIEGKYTHHNEHDILETFKNYCQSKGKKYENFIAAYRNAFDWDRCQPKTNGRQKKLNKTERARIAVGFDQEQPEAPDPIDITPPYMF